MYPLPVGRVARHQPHDPEQALVLNTQLASKLLAITSRSAMARHIKNPPLVSIAEPALADHNSGPTVTG
jgi:hypothetical protein